MKILIRNNTELPNKVNRLIKWKLYRMARKFKHMHYAEVHINTEGNNPKVYQLNIRLGIPGDDIIWTNQSENLVDLLRKSTKVVHRYLRKTK